MSANNGKDLYLLTRNHNRRDNFENTRISLNSPDRKNSKDLYDAFDQEYTRCVGNVRTKLK